MKKTRLTTIITFGVIILCTFLLNKFLFSSKDESKDVLKIASNLWPGYEPYYLAEFKGFYREKNIRPILLSSATQVMRAYRNGQIDAACLTLCEVLSLREHVEDFIIINVNDISHGGDGVIAKSSIEDLSDLKGMRIGVENSALGAFVLHRFLEISKISKEDVKIIPVEVHEHYNAFVGGNIDSVVTFEPNLTILQEKGGKLIFDSTKIPGEITDVTIVRKSFAEKNPEIIRDLLNGWYKSIEVISNLDKGSIDFLCTRLKFKEDELKESYKKLILPDLQRTKSLLEGDSMSKSLVNLEAVMLEGGYLNKKLSKADFADISYLETVK